MKNTAAGAAAAQWPDSIAIRRVDPAEWSTYRQVRLAALADAPQAFLSTLDRERELDEQVWRDRLGSAASFLAWRDGSPVGSVTVISDDQDGTCAWHLVAMWVSPAARRLGVGVALVRTAVGHASAAGGSSIRLWVFDANAGARALYEKMGFQATDLRDSRPGNPEDIEIQMIRDLRGEPAARDDFTG